MNRLFMLWFIITSMCFLVLSYVRDNFDYLIAGLILFNIAMALEIQNGINKINNK